VRHGTFFSFVYNEIALLLSGHETPVRAECNRKRTQAREERDRAERRERKGEEAARREAEKPALCEF